MLQDAAYNGSLVLCADHYGGLLETWSGGPIYCSEVTASLVHLLTGVPVDLLRPVPLDTVVVVQGEAGGIGGEGGGGELLAGHTVR